MRARALVAAGVVAASTLAAVAPAQAAVITSSANVQIITAPPSLVKNASESGTSIVAMNERSVSLSASLTYSAVDPNGVMTTKTFSVGTCLQSHLVHYDLPAGATTPALSGSATFSMPVLGILGAGTGGNLELAATDPLFGVAGTTYAPVTDLTRRAETDAILAANKDAVSTSTTDPTVLNFTFRGDGFDEIRVITACVPAPVVPEVPASVLLSISAAAVLGGGGLLRRTGAFRRTVRPL